MNGALCVMLPLYANEEIEGAYSIRVVATNDDPLAYACDYGESSDCRVFSAEWVNDKLEYLGEL